MSFTKSYNCEGYPTLYMNNDLRTAITIFEYDKNTRILYFFIPGECGAYVCQVDINYFKKVSGEGRDISDTFEYITLPAGKTWEDYAYKDNVNHPSHYNQGGMEVLDVIKAFASDLSGAEAFYAGNIIKYVLRWNHKNGVEDLEKAKVYIDKLIESRKGEDK